jgi:TatA/E family protein of Tat protein translocase
MPELIIIFVIALIIFGPRKLPELGKSLGRSLSEFRRASNELRSTLDDEIRLEEQKNAARTAAPSDASPSQPVGPSQPVAPSQPTAPSQPVGPSQPTGSGQ